MRYLGGKARVSKHLVPYLQSALDAGTGRFFEPFVGGFNLLPRLQVKEAFCSDLNQSLICMYQALQRGWIPPRVLTEAEYQQLRTRQDPTDPLTAFAAFACSFGGKEWGGYARSLKKNYAQMGCNSLQRKSVSMPRVHFQCLSYIEIPQVTPLDVIYCDPPYMKGTRYKTGTFDSERFFVWAEAQSVLGARVFISESSVINRPSWNAIWSRERRAVVSGTRQVMTEYLYVLD